MAGSFLRLFRQSFVFRLIIGFGLAAATLAVIGYLITGPCEQRIAAFDEGVRVVAKALASPMLTSILKVVTKSGSTLVLTIVGTGAVFVFLWLSWKREVVLLLVGMVGQIFLHEGFKFLIERPRPPVPFEYVVDDSYSFPSGHALASACLYGILAMCIAHRMRSKGKAVAIWTTAILLVLLIGFSRVYFNVHYASDVGAGFLAAIIWTAAIASGETARDQLAVSPLQSTFDYSIFL